MKLLLTALLLWIPPFAQATNPCDQLSPSATSSGQLHVNPEAKTSALVVHGLNNSFQVMNDLIVSLQEMGLSTFSVALSGHQGNYGDFESATKEDWLDDVQSAYCKLRGLGMPIVFVGYSLGGLLGPYLSTREDGVDFAAFVFLAPAMAIHKPLEWLSWLRVFGGGYSLPARAPKDYRLYSKVPSSAYWEYLEAKDAFSASSLEKLRVPALILIDPRDELVSAKGLRQMIARNQLTGLWNYVEVQSKHPYKHIIIDRASLGEDQWAQVKDLIQKLTVTE